jgi:glycosyltransferase involved in cell wall biosynthesis
MFKDNGCEKKQQDKRRNPHYTVCHIVRHAEIAGTERHVLLLTTGLKQKGINNCVCCFEHGNLVDRLRENEIETEVIPREDHRLHFARLVSYLRYHKHHIIHSHSGGYACVAAGLAGVKRIVYTKHGIGFTPEQIKTWSFLRKLRDRIIDHYVMQYIALTEYDKQIMVDVLKIEPAKIQVIPNGIETSFGNGVENVTNKKPIIGFVGRLTAQKGLQYLISAVAFLNNRMPDVRLVVAGSGEERNPLARFAHKLGVADNIDFLGYTSNVAEILKDVDIFVLPSVWEGFPYVLLEAMMMKKPVIATDIFGIREIIEHEKSGILVKPRDPEGLACAIENLLCHRDIARQLGLNAHRRVLERFSLDVTISMNEGLYTSML